MDTSASLPPRLLNSSRPPPVQRANSDPVNCPIPSPTPEEHIQFTPFSFILPDNALSEPSLKHPPTTLPQPTHTHNDDDIDLSVRDEGDEWWSINRRLAADTVAATLSTSSSEDTDQGSQTNTFQCSYLGMHSFTIGSREPRPTEQNTTEQQLQEDVVLEENSHSESSQEQGHSVSVGGSSHMSAVYLGMNSYILTKGEELEEPECNDEKTTHEESANYSSYNAVYLGMTCH